MLKRPRRTRNACLAAIAATLIVNSAQAEMYDHTLLVETINRVGSNVEATVQLDMVPLLSPAARSRVGYVEVVFPARGSSPLAFWSEPAASRIYAPAESIQFIGDLAILWSWFEVRNCDPRWISSYLDHAIRRQAAIGGPLSAFGLTRGALLRDRFVDDVSLKLTNTAMNFILAHELGHIVLGHVEPVDNMGSIADEMAADAFALEIMARRTVPPAGMVLYFTAARLIDPRPGEIGTHPISRDRLRAIAADLRARPDAYVYEREDPVFGRRAILSIASDIEGIADTLDYEGFVTVGPAVLDAAFPVDRLREACPR